MSDPKGDYAMMASYVSRLRGARHTRCDALVASLCCVTVLAVPHLTDVARGQQRASIRHRSCCRASCVCCRANVGVDVMVARMLLQRDTTKGENHR